MGGFLIFFQQPPSHHPITVRQALMTSLAWGNPYAVTVLTSGSWHRPFEGRCYLVAAGAVICLGAPLEDKTGGPGVLGYEGNSACH